MGDVDAVEQHGELCRVELRAQGVLVKRGQAETALLKALVDDDEAPGVPGEDLHPVAPARDEDEEVAGVDVLVPAGAHDGGEAIDAVAQVNGLRRQQNAHRPRDGEHALPERRDELGQVARVGAHRETKQHPAREGDFDGPIAPRLQRGRRYHRDRQKLRHRTGLRAGLLGAPVQPVLQRVERDIVARAEVLLLQAARLVLRQQLLPLVGSRSPHTAELHAVDLYVPDAGRRTVTEKGDLHGDFAYGDHFVSTSEFEWQSQNRTTQASKAGQLIKELSGDSNC